MTKQLPKNPRILSIAPVAKGVGFAMVDGLDALADWGIRTVKGDKNKHSLKIVKALMAQYQPNLLVLQDVWAKGSRRAPRIRDLTKLIVALAKRQKLKVVLLSRTQVLSAFSPDGQVTKEAIAEIIAKRFPDELGADLPPKRELWMSEDPRMAIFDAIALILAFRMRRSKLES